MWKDYSVSYIKHNRASTVSIIAAALLASTFLSLLCCLFYNYWVYEIEEITLDEGGWHGRIVGTFDDEDFLTLKALDNVAPAEINESLSGDETVIDIRFADMRNAYHDLPIIAETMNADEFYYHESLLSRYLINDPTDSSPPLLLPFLAVVLVLAALSLVLIIRGSFEISMNARIRQLGALKSIGAAPSQIRACLIGEAMALGLPSIVLGTALGVGLCAIALAAVNSFADDVAGRHQAVFQINVPVLAAAALASALTVLISAWKPAKKLGKMTPLEALLDGGEPALKKPKRKGVLGGLFGIGGELAASSLGARKKALRISNFSLTLSFLAFAMILCFFTLSQISTDYTYFTRYQDSWDVLVTVKNASLASFDQTAKVKEITGSSGTLYQKAEETSRISKDTQSDALMALGGLEALYEAEKDDACCFAASPIVIMDDESFLLYNAQIGKPQSLDGAVVLNRIWDSVHSNFRQRQYIPFIKETGDSLSLTGMSAEVPVLAYTDTPPALREEYDNYTLTLIMPVSLWKTLSESQTGLEPGMYISVLLTGDRTLQRLNRVETELNLLLCKNYSLESENRVAEKVSNDRLIDGSEAILAAFCALLAIIGIANVFTNTLGFTRQRKREFARYLSIGMTPADMRRVFVIEAVVIAGKPIIITLPLTALAVAFMINASHLQPEVFYERAPIIPILLFAALVVCFVALAYYIGGKRLLNSDLSQELKNDATA